MKTFLLSAVTVGALLSSAPAWAWDGTNTGGGQLVEQGIANQNNAKSNSTSTSLATGGASRASATGGAVTVNIAAPVMPATPAPTVTAPSTTASPSDTGHTATRHQNGGSGHSSGTSYVVSNPAPVASAIAPAVTSFNSCAGSAVSGAMQTGPFGISFGSGNKFDRVCWLNESGRSDAAIEYICKIDPTAREAMKHTSRPCAEDVQAVSTKTSYPYDWCNTRHAGDADQHLECNHAPATTTEPTAVDHRGFFQRLFG